MQKIYFVVVGKIKESFYREAVAEYVKRLSYVMIGVLFVVIVVWMIFSRRSQKKKQEEVQNTLDAVRPGNKVKTIGGICGIVVEVCPEDNTFILETGSEATGKSYMKFDKQAIYQTDAVAKKEEKPAEKPEEKPAEAPVEEAKEAPAAPETETAETPNDAE